MNTIEALEEGKGVLVIQLDGNHAVDTLEYVAEQIDNGMTSGYHPHWEHRDAEESPEAIAARIMDRDIWEPDWSWRDEWIATREDWHNALIQAVKEARK